MRKSVAAVLAVSVAVVLAACGSDGYGSSATTSSSTSTSTTAPSTTTTVATTTTTVALRPAPTAEVAAAAVMLAWRGGNRRAALTLAKPAAVNALFDAPPGPAEARGCNQDTGGPRDCVYRSGATEIQLKMERAPGGYVVTAAVVT